MYAIMGVGDMMDETLFTLTEQLINSLKADLDYQEVIRLDRAITDDEQLQEALTHFQTWQKAYHDVRQYGTHHPDRAQVTARYQTIKTEVFSHPLVRARLQAAQAFQTRLDKVTARLAEAVSAHVPYETGFRLHAKGGTVCSNEKV